MGKAQNDIIINKKQSTFDFLEIIYIYIYIVDKKHHNYYCVKKKPKNHHVKLRSKLLF